MTHRERIEKTIEKTAQREFEGNRWGARHSAAWREPQPIEEGVVGIVKSAALYADYHQSRFKSKLGDDGVLGPAWANILRATLTLLNGEIGRLDGGTCDGIIRTMLAEEGFGDE